MKSEARPRPLPFLSLVTLLFAVLYFISILQSIPQVIEGSGDRPGLLYLVAVLGVMFYLFTNQLATTLRLSRGDRLSWQRMARLSMAYIAIGSLSLVLGQDTVWLAQYLEASSVLVIAWMALMLGYLHSAAVRRFFTPPYAEEASALGWLLYVAGKDPFKGMRLI